MALRIAFIFWETIGNAPGHSGRVVLIASVTDLNIFFTMVFFEHP